MGGRCLRACKRVSLMQNTSYLTTYAANVALKLLIEIQCLFLRICACANQLQDMKKQNETSSFFPTHTGSKQSSCVSLKFFIGKDLWSFGTTPSMARTWNRFSSRTQALHAICLHWPVQTTPTNQLKVPVPLNPIGRVYVFEPLQF